MTSFCNPHPVGADNLPVPDGRLFLEYEIYGEDDAHERGEMIPAECFGFEYEKGEYREYHQRYDFLYYFQLDERERASVIRETYAVGGHLETIFEECDAPAYQYGQNQRTRIGSLYGVEFQMAVPRYGHECIGADEQQYCGQCFHVCVFI